MATAAGLEASRIAVLRLFVRLLTETRAEDRDIPVLRLALSVETACRPAVNLTPTVKDGLKVARAFRSDASLILVLRLAVSVAVDCKLDARTIPVVKFWLMEATAVRFAASAAAEPEKEAPNVATAC